MHADPLVPTEVLARHEAAGLWLPQTLWDLMAAHDADRIAVVCPRQGPVRYGELRAEAEGLAAVWQARGVQPGDVVIAQLPNVYDAMLTHLALTRLGAVTMSLLPSLGAADIRFVAERAGAVAAVLAPGERSTPSAEEFDELVSQVSSLGWWQGVDGGPALRELARTGDPAVLPAPPDPDDITILMATSGTTGEPKLVMHSHRSTVGGVIQSVAAEMTLTGEDVMLMPSSVAHASGLQYGLRMAALLGATLVLQDGWDPVACTELIEANDVTWIMGATPFLFDLVHLPQDRRAALSTLRLFVCGGAPIPESLAALARERLPHVSLLAAWGMSETGIATMVRPDDPAEKVTGSDGRPIPSWEFRITDAETGEDLPAGEEGEIRCRGAALFHGYLGRPDLTAEAAEDGWLRTGDLGRIDADGFLRCLGRLKDLIIRGGVNLSAVEIEDAVAQHPDVRDVAVIGSPDPRLGERICAFVVPEEGAIVPSQEALTSFLAERGVAKQKWPERVVVVDELPRTLSGKVQKFKLRGQLAEAG